MFQDFIEILILSAIQGISEFLPISSSAHLILISNFYDFKTSSLLIDISLHLGSLFAIMFYFKKDLFDLKNNKRLLGLIIVGSIPLMIFGYILHSSDLIYFVRNVEIIAWTTLFFGFILLYFLKFHIVGSAHTLKEIRNKELQKVQSIFISSLFKPVSSP